MAIREFISKLERPEGVGTWTYIDIPFKVDEAFGKKGQVKVKGTINGFAYKSSVMPHGDGTHYMVVNKSIRDTIVVSQGDEVRVTMEMDLEPRIVDIPEDFNRFLDNSPEARSKFEGFTYS